MVLILNVSPELWLDVSDATVPELSVAVGDVHDTVPKFTPASVL